MNDQIFKKMNWIFFVILDVYVDTCVCTGGSELELNSLAAKHADEIREIRGK